MLIKKYCLLIGFIGCLSEQVIATEISNDTIPAIDHLIELSIGGNYSTASPTKESMIYNNQIGYSVEKNKLQLNAKAHWIYELQNKSLSKNDFNFALDFNFYFQENKKFYVWGLNNYQTSFSLKIKNQYQAGLGLAYELINSNSFFLRISDGLIWEASDIIKSEEELIYETWRNSLRIQFKYNYTDFLKFAFTSYWQPSLKDFNDQHLKMDASLALKIWKQLDFKLEGQYNLVTATDQRNVLISYGLAYKVKF